MLTLLSSKESVVVTKTRSFIASLSRMLGDNFSPFINVFLASDLQRYEIDLVLDICETTQAGVVQCGGFGLSHCVIDEIKLLIVKQLALMLSSWTTEEWIVSFERLQDFVVTTVENAKTDKTLGAARQLLFAFNDVWYVFVTTKIEIG